MKNQCIFLLGFFFLAACSNINVFEKNIALEKQEWAGSVKPQVEFKITDTAALYNLFIVIRHSDAYGFNNIWVRCSVKGPEDTAAKSQQYNLPLANNQQGWYGSSMDDITEARILIQPDTKFTRAGSYFFTLEQTMRQDPLRHILNAGVRIEKKPAL
ncbi:MAG: gliding motility lipoprotein GldH [Chitinophagaceae bacterium]